MAVPPPRKQPFSVKNFHVENAHTGVSVGPDVSLDATGVSFKNVVRPWDLHPEADISIRGSRISDDPKLKSSGQSYSFSGWRRTKGPPLPVFCGNCGSVFPSRNYEYAGQYFNCWDNEEPCGNCQYEHAKVSEGIFDLTGDVVRIISAPDFTREMLTRVLGIAAAVNNRSISPEQAVAETEQVSSALATVWKKALAWGRPTFFALFASLPGWGSYYHDATSETDGHLSKISQSVQRQERNQEKFLEYFSDSASKAMSGGKKAMDGNGGINPKNPAQSQAPTETGTVKFNPNRNPKARYFRRRAEQQQRRDMRGDGHGAPPDKIK